MILGKQIAERLRDEVRQKPLEPNEIRRIVGMGEMYIALQENCVDLKIYTPIYSLEFDKVCYQVYSKLPAAESA